MISLPLICWNDFKLSWVILISFIINAIIHAFIDDLKANKLKINLIEDQTLHLAQIVSTALIVLKFGNWIEVASGILAITIYVLFTFLLTTDRRTNN
jgi:hypothetical protein